MPKDAGSEAAEKAEPALARTFLLASLVLLLDFDCAAAADFRRGESRAAQAGRPEEAEREPGKDDEERRIETGGERAAAEPLSEPQEDVADGAAEAGRKRPLGDDGQAGERGRKQEHAEDPRPGLAQWPARRAGAKEIPADRRERKDNARNGEAEELHGEVGEGRARSTEEIAGGTVDRVAEARIVDVPGGEA